LEETMLRVQEIDVYYGKLRAISQVSFYVNESEIVTIIGSNGAGKTTTLKAVCGLLQPRSGTILLRGKALEGKPAHVHAKMGIGYVPEGGRVFNKLTLRENLEMGAFVKRNQLQSDKDIQMVSEMFPILRDRQESLAGTLSGGERQMLSLARALMSNPELLLLDEPSLGLAPLIVHEIYEKIGEIRKKRVTILLVEQNVKRALGVADRGYVYAVGRISLAGSASNLLANQEIQKTFLGE
jgi:branched-chain amino acid transport system ATP-binding protein